jgi:flagellar motor switch protein FliN/FliY
METPAGRDADGVGAARSLGGMVDLPDFAGPPSATIDPKRITMLHDVNLNVKIELGRTRMLIEDVLRLGEGSVVELDKLAGDPVDVYANDRLIARGEVLVLNDSFCVRISEVVSADPHRVSE